MAEIRIGRSWTEDELRARLTSAAGLPRNYDAPPEALSPDDGWHHYMSEAVVARAAPGPPADEGPFTRGCTAVAGYTFSDPAIVLAHFDPDVPLDGRIMLLELRAVRLLHYLSAVIVGAVREERDADRTVFGFRYDTLEGHLERGAEWFVLTKDHASGAVRFRIEAHWRPGQFPNWWSRTGFALLGRHYQEVWHRRAHALLAQYMAEPGVPSEPQRPLMHHAPEVLFRRTPAARL